jgi:hypothetical protein
MKVSQKKNETFYSMLVKSKNVFRKIIIGSRQISFTAYYF